jgi:hypothetical protein
MEAMRRTRLPVTLLVAAAWVCILWGISLYVVRPALRERQAMWHVFVREPGGVLLERLSPRAPQGEWYALDGGTLRRTRKPEEPAAFLNTAEMSAGLVGRPARRAWKGQPQLNYTYQANILPEQEEEPSATVVWYWLPRESVFAAYDIETGEQQGEFGRDGFVAGGTAEAFGETLSPFIPHSWRLYDSTWVLVATPETAHVMHLADREIRLTLRRPEADIQNAAFVAGRALSSRYLEQPQPGAFVCLRTSDTLTFYGLSGRLIREVPLTPEEAEAPYLQAALRDDETAAVVARQSQRAAEGATIRWMALSGETTAQQTVRLPARLRNEPSPLQRPAMGALLPFTFLPVFFDAVGLEPGPPAWVASIFVAMACAAMVALLARKRRLLPWTSTTFWCAFALVGGVAALLTFLSEGGFDRTECCSECGERKRVQDGVCPGCGAPVPEPTPRGTEIFA